MKAIYIEHHGAIEDLRASEVPVPSIGPGDVLVKIEASGINPSDLGSVQGRFPAAMLPRIVGRDFAGKIVDGPADVVGTEVWGTGGDLGISRDGTHAEYVAIPREAVARRPKNLSREEASAVGVPFVTAFSALVRVGQLKKGEWVIVSGAAGSVGQAATEIAHAKGAHVVALIKDADARWVSESGAVRATAQSDLGDLNRVVREATNGKGVEWRGRQYLWDAPGGARRGRTPSGLLGGGGREFPLDLLNLYRNQFAVFGLDTQKFDATMCAGILSDLGPLFESGALKPPKIAERYKLSQVREAYGRVASGQGDKVVFVPA